MVFCDKVKYKDTVALRGRPGEVSCVLNFKTDTSANTYVVSDILD